MRFRAVRCKTAKNRLKSPWLLEGLRCGSNSWALVRPGSAKVFVLNGELAGTRTQDPRLKRAMLYQLSYELSPFQTYHRFNSPPGLPMACKCEIGPKSGKLTAECACHNLTVLPSKLTYSGSRRGLEFTWPLSWQLTG